MLQMKNVFIKEKAHFSGSVSPKNKFTDLEMTIIRKTSHHVLLIVIWSTIEKTRMSETASKTQMSGILRISVRV